MLRVLLLLLAAPLALAAPDIRVSDGWAREVPPVSRNSAGYLLVENRGDRDDLLLSAGVEGARVTELHEMVRDGAVMVMRRRDSIPVPAGGSVRLAPGGLHLMLIDLARPLVAGETRSAVLRFRDAGEVKLTLDVRANAGAPHQDGHGSPHNKQEAK